MEQLETAQQDEKAWKGGVELWGIKVEATTQTEDEEIHGLVYHRDQSGEKREGHESISSGSGIVPPRHKKINPTGGQKPL